MRVIITQYGITICSSNNMTMLPRIGETIRITGSYYKVKDVVWHIENNIYIEIKIQ